MQLTSLVALQKERPELEIVLVTEQDSSAFRQFLSAYAIRAEYVFDPAGELVQALGLRSIPATLFVDGANLVQGYYEGVLSTAELSALGGALAQGQTVPVLTVPGNPGAEAAALPNVDWAKAPNNLLVFVQLTCSHCIEEIPELVSFAELHPETAVWLIALDQASAVTAQYTEAGAPSNVQVIGSEDSSLGARLFTDYQVSGTPTQILVDSTGTIRWRNVGYAPGASIFVQIPLETAAK